MILIGLNKKLMKNDNKLNKLKKWLMNWKNRLKNYQKMI